MQLKIDGGFVELNKTKTGNISLVIGCDHYYPDGTRKETVVNTAEITVEEFAILINDVFPQNLY